MTFYLESFDKFCSVEKMGNARMTSEKSSSLPEKPRNNSFLTQSNTTSIPEQEQHIHSKSDPDRVGFDAYYDDSFDDEEEEAARWSLEQRAAALQNIEIARERFLKECDGLKDKVSRNVNALLQDLPDAHDPEFETKYKTVRQKLQKFFPKTWNKSKQKTKSKKK